MLDLDDLKSDSIFNKPRIDITPGKTSLGIDIELSNHCNARCYYCPRDQITETGFMDETTFKTIINQAYDYPEELILGACGHGESILHPKIGEYIRYVTDKGMRFGLQTNGSLMDAAKRSVLLDAGLARLNISVSATGDLYEKMYQLAFKPVLENIKKFIQEAQGACDIGISIVQTDLNRALIKDDREFWLDLGVNRVDVFPVGNRSGTISHKNIIYSDNKHHHTAEDLIRMHHFTSLCSYALLHFYIGWDGKHYLCANDWEKKVPIGHVSEMSLDQALHKKVDMLQKQSSIICGSCDRDVINRIKECLSQAEDNYIIDTFVSARKKEEAIFLSLLSDKVNMS